ncbi:macrolide ABC transporter ATP-binding protein [Candidatus Giovannonibacteria bacterium RIFCSPHIGHO2_01_FULL_48_47]|nr:MAG: macrolide ABC transporter ATP-binding protein [Candidatus Giovannonibacteria bacterium RIFCSPHIGHO2_01_FULL_48_47]OGF68457.1 MAG: macrolide ABC transporter ATP-binding protein [Candidatus Giovannonibacteria bacterium RIFCSPHIGHO2_02_FULL_48_15]OGF88775.1 MAG: macrolide ABC transporter ATP-binding protein [Candidatus Giovannonibacteria bacterium RIFCSPLOWO2_01_FULL_48_47]OGF94480.1 MAG: macrolide ABC transporter ATP-binding protein [Candidatus Giovannonibacteria bacterium RIFOXYC1_FULL_48
MIEVKNLEKIYEAGEVKTPALGGVSFEIKDGEFVAIMGPSGSGKSTLLHVLGFLDRPSSGVYRFGGKAMDDYSDEELAKVRNRKMGFVFQAFNLLPRATVFENVKLPLLYSEVPEQEWKERTEKAIKAVGLSPRRDHEAFRLSGGEKQRAAIARALVLTPEVIFADEPTGNLDTKSGEAVIKILKNLNQEGRHTIILVTHEEEIARQASRLITLRDGRIESDKIFS